MLLSKQKKNQAGKGNRFLISITVVGSSGPIRFVVNEKDLVASVIDQALKSYAREGRLPVLGSDLNNFELYCPVSGLTGMNHWETIGSCGVRNFMLYQKLQSKKDINAEKSASMARKGLGSWKSWFHKSLSRKISSH